MNQINWQSLYHLDITAILHKSHSNEKCNIFQKKSFPQTYCFTEVKYLSQRLWSTFAAHSLAQPSTNQCTNRTKYIWPAKRKPEFHCHQLTMSSTSLFQREREMNSWHSHSQHQNHASFPQITFISTLIPAPSMDPHSRNTLLWQPISRRTQLLYKQIKRPNFQQVYDKLGNVLKPFWCS